MENINGEPVTEEQIQEWADEAERGYDVDAFCKRVGRDETSRSEVIHGAILPIPHEDHSW